MRNLLVYLKMISLSFQNSITYKIEYFTSVLNAFLYIFIFVSVWSSLIPEKEIINGISKDMMVSYAVLSTLIKSTFARSQFFLSSKVRTGEIAVELMKPISLPLLYFSDMVGKTLFQVFARGFPILFVSLFLYKIQFSIQPEILIKFLVLYILSFLLYFFISFFISSLSFYFVEIFPFWILYFAMVTLLSGGIIPIDFFPESIRSLILLTPFPYLFYFPTILLLRTEILMPYLQLIVVYILHIISLMILSLSLYHFGLKKLYIAGG